MTIIVITQVTFFIFNFVLYRNTKIKVKIDKIMFSIHIFKKKRNIFFDISQLF